MRFLLNVVLASIALAQINSAHSMNSISSGSVAVVISINNVEIDVPIVLQVKIDTEGGVLNADGAINFSANNEALNLALKSIGNSILPHKFPTDQCDFTISNLTEVEVASIKHEFRLSATADIKPEDCHVPKIKGTIELAFIPVRIDKSTIKFEIPRDPNISVTWPWGVIAEIIMGDLGKAARKNLQNFLDTNDRVKITIPLLEGVNAAFQGTNFNASENSIVFRVIGDAHIEPRAANKIITEYLIPRKFHYSITLK